MINNPYNYINPYMNNVQSMQQLQTQSQSPMQQGLIRVTGIEGAKAYQMYPNSTTALFDNNEDIFYVKSTDGAGFGTIKVYKFTAVEQETKTEQTTEDFVTRQEFEQLRQEVMNNGKQSISKRTNKDKSTNDE
ncbi:MAG: hypothetical protein HFE51_05085 [Clostridia bacterium]|nr:hypothetical protein [Clostridia bacterium]